MRRDATTFRTNLQQLAAVKGVYDAKQLANALGFVGEDRRWIKRLWEQGLSHASARSHTLLKKLTAFLEVAGSAELWKPNLVLSTYDRQGLISQIEVSQVVAVIHAYRQLQAAKHLRPMQYLRALKQYDYSESMLIADWVCAAQCLSFEEWKMLSCCFDNTLKVETEEVVVALSPLEIFDKMDNYFATNSQWQSFLSSLKSSLQERIDTSCDLGE